jgi:hypothetical protein
MVVRRGAIRALLTGGGLYCQMLVHGARACFQAIRSLMSENRETAPAA